MNSLIIKKKKDENNNKIKNINLLKQNYIKINNTNNNNTNNNNTNNNKILKIEEEKPETSYLKKHHSKEEQIINKSTNTYRNSLIKKIITKNENKEKEKEKNLGKEIQKKEKNHIKFDLEKTLYYNYKEDSTLFDYYELYNKNKEQLPINNDIMNLNKYMKSIKNRKNLKPCIKHYNTDEIKINEEYKDAENLSEKDIIPDLYKEEDEDIKSLEKSLENSIDKSFDKNYEKLFSQYYNDKYTNITLNDLSNSNTNESSNKDNKEQKGKNLVSKKIYDMYIEEVDEENEEYENEDFKK